MRVEPVGVCAHVSGPRSEGTETRSEHDTNVADVNGEVDSMEKAVDDTASGHQTGIDCSSHYTA